MRYYNQAHIKVLIYENNDIKVFRADTTTPQTALDPSREIECTASSSTATDRGIHALFATSSGAIRTNRAFYDAREGVHVRVADVDISRITAAVEANSIPGFNGVLYITDTTPAYEGSTSNRKIISSPMALKGSLPVSTAQRGIRLINGHSLPRNLPVVLSPGISGGLTVISNNPVYIKGNYNTGPGAVPSNANATGLPVSSGYTRRPACVVGDSVNILSGAWDDGQSSTTIFGGGYVLGNPRSATSTTVNTAIVAGNVPTSAAGYSGGGETFLWLQEDWRTQNFIYYGSLVQLFRSIQGNSPGSPGGNFHKNPGTMRFFYDHEVFADNAPPGKLVIAAYLQQQRWYQVY